MVGGGEWWWAAGVEIEILCRRQTRPLPGGDLQGSRFSTKQRLVERSFLPHHSCTALGTHWLSALTWEAKPEAVARDLSQGQVPARSKSRWVCNTAFSVHCRPAECSSSSSRLWLRSGKLSRSIIQTRQSQATVVPVRTRTTKRHPDKLPVGTARPLTNKHSVALRPFC